MEALPGGTAGFKLDPMTTVRITSMAAMNRTRVPIFVEGRFVIIISP
jgi:hypothetical protein